MHAPSALPRVVTLWLDYADQLARVEAGELPAAEAQHNVRAPEDAMAELAQVPAAASAARPQRVHDTSP